MKPEPDEHVRAGTTNDWAICCSGGGIRSAAYCLGALQSLDRDLVAKARWILGVSGGSYIAASRALVAHNLPAGTTPHAYAPGTAEERNLRYNTRYIAPDVPTILVGVLSLLLGAIGTFIIALAPLYAVADAWGWLLRWQGALAPSGPHAMTAAVTGLAWWLPSVIAAGITLLLFLYWWWTLQPGGQHSAGRSAWPNRDDRDRGTERAWLVSWAARLTTALALAMLAVPPLISWLTRSTGSLGKVTHFFGFGGTPSWSLSGVAAVIAAVAAVARYSQAGLAKWTASTSAAKGGSAAASPPGLLGGLAGRMRQLLLPWLASAVVVLIGAVLVLLWVSDGARAGFSRGQLLPVGVALAVTLAARVAVNVNRLSMHDFYRWRLADAFAVTRQAAQAAATGQAAQAATGQAAKKQKPATARMLFAEAAATRLSELRDSAARANQPGLVICATANINAVRETPPGQDGFCVTFDPEHVTLHREKGLADGTEAKALTSDYEALIGQRRSTLFDISAISGAAVSPLMGSATRHAYRILFTAANISLGVWLPHPNLVRDARTWINPTDSGAWWERRPSLLLLWYLMPHLLWGGNEEKNYEREARLWGHVLKLRLAGKRSGALWYRVMQPTLGLLWAEAAGRLSYRGTWMYVTDGGHYDNLALVEALRRGASNIVVLDASGDKADTWSTLGGAIALARAEAGVEIDIDPTAMVRSRLKLAAGEVARPWVHGQFRRPHWEAELPRQGNIWVCKLGWWADAPWDIRAYASEHPTYPCDSTVDQLYDAAEFEAYHQLGAAAAADAAEHCEPPLKWPAVPAATSASRPSDQPADGPPAHSVTVRRLAGRHWLPVRLPHAGVANGRASLQPK